MTLTAGNKGKLVALLAFARAAGSCGPSMSLPQQNGTSMPGRNPSRSGGPVLPRDMSDASTRNSPPPDATGAGPVASAEGECRVERYIPPLSAADHLG
jgi:hypothetical protein